MGTPPRQYPYIVDSASLTTDCTCGKPHPAPQVTLYSGADACRILAEDCQALDQERPVLLLSDPETDAVAGKALREELQSHRIVLEHYFLDSDAAATESLAEKIQSAGQGKSLIIGVGAGTINDLAKFAADRNGVDCWSMATAPSMNGYTSGIVALKVKGVKRTLPAAPPKRIYAIPQVIQQAPLKLRQAGYCDVQAKVVSDIDWQCEALLCSGGYCGLPSALMHEAEQGYASYPEAVGRGERDVVQGLFQGLLISGVAMSLTGSSAPASGGEHLFSHFLDMREAITRRKPELHGLQVGVGIILSTACYARLAQCKAADLTADSDKLFTAAAEKIPEIWGDLAGGVIRQFERKRETLSQFDQRLPEFWNRLQPLFVSVPSPKYFAARFVRTGAPFTLEAFRLTVAEFRLAALNARTIRERITVLDLAAYAGVLDAAVDDTQRLLS